MSFAGRTLSIAWTALSWLALGVALGLAGATTLPALAGFKTLDVLTGSMEPSIGVGAVVIDEPIKPGEARPGDVITFPDPDNRDRLLTHRVKRVSVRQGRVYAVTRGDANDSSERWNVAAGEEIGRVRFVAPKLGYVRRWATGWGGRLTALAAVLLWGISAIRDIWRPDQRDAPARSLASRSES